MGAGATARVNNDAPSFGPCVVLSPHFDDAALSCAALLQGGWVTESITVFAGTPGERLSVEHDLACGFADANAASTARAREDVAAMALEGVPVRHLPLLQSGYGERTDADRDALAALISSITIDDATETYLALPAGAGRPSGVQLRRRGVARVRAVVEGRPRAHLPHADHLWLRDEAVPLALTRGLIPLLYEEFPAAVGGPADDTVAAVAKRHGVWPEIVVLAVDRKRKASLVESHRSQLATLFPDRSPGRLAKVLPASERYWVLRPPRRGSRRSAIVDIRESSRSAVEA